MAAALLQQAAGDRLEIRSAGTKPAEAIHPGVIEAMGEIGADLSELAPRALAEADVQIADVVVTMGCGDACPVYPGKRYEDWDLPDPAGQPLERVREIRDLIKARVDALADDLLSDRA